MTRAKIECWDEESPFAVMICPDCLERLVKMFVEIDGKMICARICRCIPKKPDAAIQMKEKSRG